MRNEPVSLSEFQKQISQEDRNEKASAIFEKAMQKKEGRGCPQDHEEAVQYLLEAAELNSAAAARELGICYTYGLGVGADQDKAIGYFLQAAELKDAEAMYRLFQNFSLGIGIPAIDETMADNWLEEAARLGHSRARTVLKSLSDKKELGKDLEQEKGRFYSTFHTLSPNVNGDIPHGGEEYVNKDEIADEKLKISMTSLYATPAFWTYIISGIVSGLLVVNACNHAKFLEHHTALAGNFTNMGIMALYMIFAGIVLGIIMLFTVVITADHFGIKRWLFVFIPVLFMPVIVAELGLVLLYIIRLFKWLVIIFAVCWLILRLFGKK